MGKDGKHIHFSFDDDFSIESAITDYIENHSRRLLRHHYLFVGRLTGTDSEKIDLFYSIMRDVFRAGTFYGLKNKDKLKITEHKDVECEREEDEYENIDEKEIDSALYR